MYRYDTVPAARIKYLMNVCLDPANGEQLVADLFAELVQPDEEFCRDLYASREQVAELEWGFGALGGHGYAHRPLSLMSDRERAEDMRSGAAVLASITGGATEIISYPYGSASSVSTDVARTADSVGFKVGLTMERAVNRSLLDPMLLARIDFNDAPFGRRPLLEIDGDALRMGEGMTGARRRYLDEEAAIPRDAVAAAD
jgi:peptidoglycan/xylan/chitin deacetylase (PgdA/CDA1 family)